MHLLLPFQASLNVYSKDKSRKIAEKRQIKRFLAFFWPEIVLATSKSW